MSVPAQEAAKPDAAKPAEAAKKVDPSGTWKWSRERNGETIASTLKLALKDGKLTGTFQSGYQDPEIKREISNGKVDGDTMSCEVKFEFNEREVTLKFEGKLNKEQDAIDGKLSFGTEDDAREFEWQAKRVVEPDDVVGTWDLKISFGEQVFEPKLIVAAKDGKLSATYESRFGEIDVKEIAVKDAELSFTIERERDGTKITSKYKGKPRGNSIAGTVEYVFNDQPGTAEFEGTRAAKEEKKEEKKEAATAK
jgi:hypothetical protein